MSVTTPPAQQKPSVLAAFQTAPTLVKVLASILSVLALLTLIQMAVWGAAGRNEPCPGCSGHKYKKCHVASAERHQRSSAPQWARIAHRT